MSVSIERNVDSKYLTHSPPLHSKTSIDRSGVHLSCLCTRIQYIVAMTDSDIIIEICRRKLSKQVLYSPDTKIIGVVEATSSINQLQYRSKSRTVVNGITFSIPLLPNFSSVKLNLSSVNGPVTTHIGSCLIPKSECLDSNDPDDEPAEKVYKVFNTNEDSVGKVRCLVYIQPRFLKEGGAQQHRHKHKHMQHRHNKHRTRRTGIPVIKEASRRTEIPQGFRFRKTDRAIHWDRIRNLNMERVVLNNDTAMLMSCIDDIALGNLEDEDVDPRLHHTMQLAQYSTQYLLGCQTLLNQRKTVIGQAYQCFEQEEAELDMEIAKLRARNSALSREDDDLRDLQLQYTSLLEDISPGACASHTQLSSLAPHTQQGRQQERQLEGGGEERVRPHQDPRERRSEQLRDDPWRQSRPNHPESWQEGSSPSTQTQLQTQTQTQTNTGVNQSSHPEAQKPPILRRVVSKEYLVGSGIRPDNPLSPESVNTGVSDNRIAFDTPDISPGICSPPDWNKPKSVTNFSHTVDSNMDKTAATNMSVDSLMGSRNNLYGGGSGSPQNVNNTNTNVNRFALSTPYVVVPPSSEKSSEGNSNLGVAWSDHDHVPATTATGSTIPANSVPVSSSGLESLVHKVTSDTTVVSDSDDVITFPSKPLQLSRTQSDHSAVPSTASNQAADKNNYSKTAPISFPLTSAPANNNSSDHPRKENNLNEDDAATHAPLSKRAHSFDTRSGVNRSHSLQSLLAMNRTSSFNSVGSLKRQDISLEVINDHDNLFEHSESMEEASFLSPTAAITHHNEPLQTENDHKRGSDDEDEDVHEFSFLSDVAEGNVHDTGRKISTSSPPRDRVMSDEYAVVTADQALKSEALKDEEDMKLVDTSDFSFDDPQGQPGPDEIISETVPVTSKKNDDVLDDTAKSIDNTVDHRSSVGTEGDITSPTGQLTAPAVISPSITIHMHRNAEDEDQDDVLLGTGTNHFTATYTSRDTESSYNDTDEYQLTDGGGTSLTMNTNTLVSDAGRKENEQQGQGQGQPQLEQEGQHQDQHQDETQSVTFDDDGKEDHNGGETLADVTQLSTEDGPTDTGTEENEASGSSCDSKTDASIVNPIHWLSGRAPLELVETANALDVFISAVRFDSTDYAKIPKVGML